jgi:hypothetical protein
MDVSVVGFKDELVFNCEKELDPRASCYQLYKLFSGSSSDSSKQFRQNLHNAGIHKLKFATSSSMLTGYSSDWELDVP